MKSTILKRYFNILMCAGLVYLSSCQKDIDYFIPDPGLGAGPDTSWAALLTDSMPVQELKQSLLIEKNVDVVNITSTVNHTTSAGLQLSLNPANLLTGAGIPASGNITVTSGLYTRKGELIRMNLSSLSNFGALATGGVVYLDLRQNNQPLQLAQGSVFSFKYSPESIPGNMNIYNGQFQTYPTIYWSFNYDTMVNRLVNAGNLLQVNTNSFGWLNAGSLLNTSQQGAGSVTVKLPVNYTNKNSTVWLVMNNKVSALNFVPYIDQKSFILGSLPENTSAKIIVMSKQAGAYYFAQQDITISATGHANPVFITPVISTLDNIKGYLNSL